MPYNAHPASAQGLPGRTEEVLVRREQMDRMIEEHLAAEKAGDPNGCVAAYTDDVIHDVVGMPDAVIRGPGAARERYEWLTKNLHIERMDRNHQWYGDDFCVIEHQLRGTVPGELMGIPGNNRRISFRILHVWEFKDDAMSRENVWLDSGAIIEQLTAKEPAEGARRETADFGSAVLPHCPGGEFVRIAIDRHGVTSCPILGAEWERRTSHKCAQLG
jgi:hypothetical protein